jgi:hypothetical protein
MNARNVHQTVLIVKPTQIRRFHVLNADLDIPYHLNPDAINFLFLNDLLSSPQFPHAMKLITLILKSKNAVLALPIVFYALQENASNAKHQVFH